MSKRRILVVEDSSTQAEALAALLDAHNYEVVVAPDGDIAIDLLQDDGFDLVLSDVLMQRVGGYELCRRLKADPSKRDVPVVLLTSLANPLDIVRGLECGADNYITKPYEPEQLLARIRQVLDRRALRRTPRSTLGVEINFLGSNFSITSEKEQILDLFLSSVEDIVVTNRALEESQRQLSAAHAQLESYARQLERSERLSTEKYGKLMRRATEGIFVLDLDGSILEANPRAADLVSVPVDVLPGRLLESLLPPDEVTQFRTAFAQLRAKGEMTMPELRLGHNSGRTFFCELRISATLGSDDNLALAILHDNTARKLALDELSESKETLGTLIEASPLPIIALDRDSRVTLWNESAQRVFGYSGDEVVGRPAPVIPEDRIAEAQNLHASILAGQRISNIETVRRAKSGDLLQVSIWAAPLQDPAGQVRGMVMLVADMSEQKALKQQLLQAQKMEAVGALAGGIAHDFNNVLTAITGYSEMLLQDPRQPEALHGDIQEIRNAADRATSLTRQLLAFSRKQLLQPEPVDVNVTVKELDKMLRRLIPEHIELSLELEPDPVIVHVDPSQLEQVILNLVVNARDALQGGGRVVIRTHRAELGPHDILGPSHRVQAGPYAILVVEDNGEGIDPAVLPKIFDPFFTTKSKEKGTGLGLSTVYGIVKQSGGYVTVASELGRGTTMTVFLPLLPVDTKPARETRTAQRSRPEASQTAAPRTVLLAEDEGPLRRLLIRVLRQAGYTILEAVDGAEASTIAREHKGKIDLLLTDLIMPDMGGVQLADRVHALHPGIKTVFMSGYTEEGVLPEGWLELGVAFVEKPFSTRDLLRRIHDELAK